MTSEPTGSALTEESGASEQQADAPSAEYVRLVEERLERSTSLLQATLDSTTDGVLVVDRDGRIVSHNRRFLEIWEIPESVMEAGDDGRAIQYVLDKLEDPESFVDRVKSLYADPARTGYDVLLFRDGRVIERYSRPQRLGQKIVGRVWTYRDVTEQKRMQQALISSERRYRRLFEESRHALYITTRDGGFVDVNRSLLDLFGYSRREMLRLSAGNLYADEDGRERFQAVVEEQGSVRNHEVRLVDRDGNRLECVVTATARRGPEGEVIGYEGIIEDVTERKRSTEALRQSEQYYRSLIENALDTITILEKDGTIKYESPAVERVLGYVPEELVGRSAFDYVHPDDHPRVKELFRRSDGTPGVTETVEFRFRHRDGSWRTLEAVGNNLLDDPAVGGVVVNARDVTQRKEAEERLLYDAFHDRLTGLPNRALFMNRLRKLVKRGSREGTPGYAVLFMDADRFKVVNDSLGHAVGDQLLMELGRRVERCLRPGDTVSRVGGDEFAVIVDGSTGAGEAEQVARRIHGIMEQPFEIAHRDVYVTVSIGIAVSADRYRRAEEILRDADIAMYRAKESGRSRTKVFNQTMHGHAMAVLELETDLRRAVDNGEFELRYQPIVSLETGALVGYESLIRWRHPTRGTVMPADFLSVAEETGLIVPIGWWTLREAASRVSGWWDPDRQGPFVAVNLSATQLSQPDLVPRIRGILDETGVAPSALRLELTENLVMQKAEATARTLTKLRDLGVALMIDDFGMGYSSLSYLHRFAADTLKIDSSFIAGIGPNFENSEIVRTIVALADQLGMDVVAEGVETQDQFRIVRALGCAYGQGYHLARPLEPEDADASREKVWALP